MKKYTLLLFLFLLAGNCFADIDTDADNENPLDVEITDPTLEHEPIRRSPKRRPEIIINGHSLQFIKSCDNCILSVTNENGEIEYMDRIPQGVRTYELPSYLYGNYRIQIIGEQIYIERYITL